MKLLTNFCFDKNSTVKEITFFQDEQDKVQMHFILNDIKKARLNYNLIQGYLDMNQSDPGELGVLEVQVNHDSQKITFHGNLYQAICLLQEIELPDFKHAIELLVKKLADSDEIELHQAMQQPQKKHDKMPSTRQSERSPLLTPNKEMSFYPVYVK